MRLTLLLVPALVLSTFALVAAPVEAHPCYGYPVQCGGCEISTKHQHICITLRPSAVVETVSARLLA